MKRSIKEWMIVIASLADDAAVVIIILVVLWLLKIPVSLPIIIFIAVLFVALAFPMHKLIISALPLGTFEVAALNITSASASISWKTNDKASSQVFYDAVDHDNLTDYAYQTNADLRLVSRHSMELSVLAPGAIYHFRVKSTADQVITISNDKTFTTAGGRGSGLKGDIKTERQKGE
jgi:hypothetical protein